MTGVCHTSSKGTLDLTTIEFNAPSLFAANAVVLAVMAAAFLIAWKGQPHESYWKSWFQANVVLTTALVIYVVQLTSADPASVFLPEALLILGFGLRWQAARQFAGRAPRPRVVLGPAVAFTTLCAVPPVLSSNGAVYTICNIVLTVQALAITFEFWRDRSDRLPSRYGLVAAYAAIAVSFGARVGQGMFFGSEMETYLPDDSVLLAHLVVALFMTTASGAFAISIAYERGAIKLQEAAMRDPLTGLCNRRAFEARIRRDLSNPGEREFAVALLDIDHFKAINDRHGHAAGDEALRNFATRCLRSLRESDFLARIGGEEFAIILPDVSAAEAFRITDELREAVGSSELEMDCGPVSLTLSAGICHSSAAGRDYDELMKLADVCLYRAKEAGRNRVEHPPEQDHAALSHGKDEMLLSPMGLRQTA